MIVFKGEHSKECTTYICKLQYKTRFLQALYVVFFAEIPMCIIFIAMYPKTWLFTLLISLLVWVFCNFILFRPVPKKEYGTS